VSDAAHADIKKHVRVYITVFAALAVLTIVTVAVAYLHLSFVPAVTLALLIASVKGGLVAAYFMHLVSEKKVIYWILIVTVVFFAAMFIIFPAAHADQAGGM
jgi:cytochrome c oxidase subunit 4